MTGFPSWGVDQDERGRGAVFGFVSAILRGPEEVAERIVGSAPEHHVKAVLMRFANSQDWPTGLAHVGHGIWLVVAILPVDAERLGCGA
jgi:hypothetical protein